MTPRVLTCDETLAEMARVLTVEAAALTRMAAEVGDAQLRAVEILEAMEGRVIVSGVGKSGHIGNKIAATLASTGTPAQFVHATEASHGDLGMVTPRDVCLVISNSGETSELADIVTYSRRFAIPLIAITRKADSTLATQADVVLLLPDAPEACGIGMAPTTSTTCTLALGDALAVALMTQRGFERENFLDFHPALAQPLDPAIHPFAHLGRGELVNAAPWVARFRGFFWDERPKARKSDPLRGLVRIVRPGHLGEEEGGVRRRARQPRRRRPQRPLPPPRSPRPPPPPPRRSPDSRPPRRCRCRRRPPRDPHHGVPRPAYPSRKTRHDPTRSRCA